MTVYLDSSAIAKLVLREPESAALATFLAQASRPASSRLAEVEVRRALLRRLTPDGRRLDLVLDAITLIDLHPDIFRLAGRLVPAELRSPEAIHLATALALERDLEAFVTYDLQMAAGARALGMTVLSPGDSIPGHLVSDVAAPLTG